MDIQVNGQPFTYASAHRGSFIPLSRNWHAGDTISLNLPLQTVLMSPTPV